jgi:dTDP-4-dehydrorhamnose 3,5-epimerase-like enzyme
MTQANDIKTPRRGLFLKLEDFKAIEKFYEEVRTDELDADEKKTLWKIKTIIHNIESARLR